MTTAAWLQVAAILVPVGLFIILQTMYLVQRLSRAEERMVGLRRDLNGVEGDLEKHRDKEHDKLNMVSIETCLARHDALQQEIKHIEDILCAKIGRVENLIRGTA